MSLLMKTAPVTESSNHSQAQESPTKTNDELTLTVKTINAQISSMSADMKAKKQSEADSLEEMFVETVTQKGESNTLNINRNSERDLEIEGISQMTLHSFLLKAEELGKNITYTRTLKVEITD